ncbi:MAG TPA: hypothetical protein ENF52_05110 [Chloroflexi bacterium]|nr:hypothetical protein [Chloroflexota bacterium]
MDEENHPPYASDTGDQPQSQADVSVEILREILIGRYRQQIAELKAELDDLERRIADKEALAVWGMPSGAKSAMPAMRWWKPCTPSSGGR